MFIDHWEEHVSAMVFLTLDCTDNASNHVGFGVFVGIVDNKKKNIEFGQPYLSKSLSSTVTNGHRQFYCVPEET